MTYIEVFLLLGGLGMFLFGMKVMGMGLTALAGERLQGILEKATRRPIMGLLLGTGVTALIQSSGATNIMTIGFVSSGMMTVSQSVGVVMGANIGTTITGQIIAFHLTDFAPAIIFVGAVLFLFVKNENVHSASEIILGFGILFEGVALMSDAVAPLRESPAVLELLDTLSNPMLALLIGLIITSILQSSSSAVGIIQVFSMQGLIDVRMAIFMVVGTNIGAVVPVALAAISANRNGKRVALSDLIFNVFRTIICAVVLLIFPQIIDVVVNSSMSPSRQIAVMHTAMAIVCAFVMLPFTKRIARLSEKILPINERELRTAQKKLNFISNVDVPVGIKLNQIKAEMMRMAHMASENLQLSIEAFFDGNAEKIDTVHDTEEVVDYLCHHITNALVSVNISSLSENQLNRLGAMIKITADIERVSDHADNIAEYAADVKAHGIVISPAGMRDMHDLCEKAVQAVNISIDIYENQRVDLVEESYEIENEVDRLNQKCVEKHIDRMMHDECSPRSGVVYTEMAANLERAADHAHNIVKALDGVVIAED